MFEKLSKDQFNYIIEAMCFYKKLNPDKEVTLSERCAKDVMNFFNREGNKHIPMLNAMTESGLSMEELIDKANKEINKSKEKSDPINEVSEEEVDDDSD
tara:strand:- start:669 stop:965 length:297 start_codon:yes stop_codon:yes gene_type:complete